MKFSLFLVMTLASFKAFSSTETPEDNLKSIELGKHFPSVGIIMEHPTDEFPVNVYHSSYGSGSLIDHENLGLPNEYQGRLFLTCSHGLIDMIHQNGRILENFSVFFQTSPSMTYLHEFEKFGVQTIWYPKEYKPQKKSKGSNLDLFWKSSDEPTEILPDSSDGDIAFVVLDRSVPLSGFKLHEYNRPIDFYGAPVTFVGFGLAGQFSSNVQVRDMIKRAGHTLINHVSKRYPFRLSTASYEVKNVTKNNPYLSDTQFHCGKTQGYSRCYDMPLDVSELFHQIPYIEKALKDEEPYTYYLEHAIRGIHTPFQIDEMPWDYTICILKPRLPLVPEGGASGGPILFYDSKTASWLLIGLYSRCGGTQLIDKPIRDVPFQKGSLDEHMQALKNIFSENDVGRDITTQNVSAHYVFAFPYFKRLKKFLEIREENSDMGINGF